MSNRLSARLLAVVALFCAALISHSSSAGTISLAWDPVVHPDLAGYRVYYDTAPDVFGNSVDADPDSPFVNRIWSAKRPVTPVSGPSAGGSGCTGDSGCTRNVA